MNDRTDIKHETDAIRLGARPMEIDDRVDMDAQRRGIAGLLQTVRRQSRERGWLFSVVSGWCMSAGLLCIAAAGYSWLRAGIGADPAELAVARSASRILLAGVIIVLSTVMMWRLNVWGRNVAIVTVACLSWVIGDLIQRKTGVGIEAQAMTVAFVAMAMACMTTQRVRDFYLYSTSDPDELDAHSQGAKDA